MSKCLEFKKQLDNKTVGEKMLEKARSVLSDYFFSVLDEIVVNQKKHNDYGIDSPFEAFCLLREAFKKASVILCNQNPNMNYLRPFNTLKCDDSTSIIILGPNHIEFIEYCISVFVDNFLRGVCSAEEYKSYHIVLNFCPEFAKAKEKENQISPPGVVAKFLDDWFKEEENGECHDSIIDDDDENLPF